jgi:hypothetical protein
VATARGIAASELSISGVTEVYANTSNLPISSVSAGTLAYVESVSSLYFYSGSGWYKISVINTNPNITTGPDASYAFATDGTPIVLTLEAQDPEEVPIAWSYVVTSGVLGSTATVQQEGNVFTITPSVNEVDAGTFSITFTASDGVNIATSVSAFTLLFGVADQYYNYNSLLLKSGSTAGLNNHTFVDESTNSHTVTRSGDVYQGSLSPYSPAGWSAYFDGVNDKIIVSGAQTVSGTFTFECWINTTKVNTHIMTKYPGGGSTIDVFATNASGRLISAWPSGTADITSTTNVCDGQWHHAAFCRDGTTYRLFVDGVLESTVTNSENGAFGTGTPWVIGQHGNNAIYLYQGHINDLRLVLGTAVYTSNFTPPTEPLTAIPGTEILTCQGNRFIDNSPNNFSLTPSGTIISAVSPHLPSKKYDPTIHGGSAYFDGTGDYLTVPAASEIDISTGDFTIEFWVYPFSKTNSVDSVFGYGNFRSMLYHNNSTWTWEVGNGTSNYFSLTATTTINSWQHIALTRSGNAYTFWLNGVSANNTTNTNGPATSSVPLYIGLNNSGGTQIFTGYMSNLRVVKGTALYTSAFTPPDAPLTAISGTSLLTCQSNRFIDNETTKNNIKVLANTTTSTTQTKYNDTSVYFDGAGDALVIPGQNAANFGTGNFTLEMHVYIAASTGTYQCFYCSRNGGAGFFFGTAQTSRKIIYYTSSAHITDPTELDIGVWYHIALVRNNGLTTLYRDGVSVGTYSDTINYTSTQAELGKDLAFSFDLNGYLSDVRITNGVARYTANFTPPTASLGFNNAE